MGPAGRAWLAIAPSARRAVPLPSVVQRGDGLLTRALVSLRLRGLDLADRVTGRRDPLIPPRRMSQYVGHGDFAAVGQEFLALMRTHAGLAPGDRVLDVGCGIGRMARVLTTVLRPPGTYDGFDVARFGHRMVPAALPRPAGALPLHPRRSGQRHL